MRFRAITITLRRSASPRVWAFLIYTGMFPGGQKNVLTDTMREAYFDMLTKAAGQGANAIVGVRYATPSSDNERIVLVYGTAVAVQKAS